MTNRSTPNSPHALHQGVSKARSLRQPGADGRLRASTDLQKSEEAQKDQLQVRARLKYVHSGLALSIRLQE